MTPDELAALVAAGRRLIAMLEEERMSDNENTIAITYDRRHGANVYIGDRLLVTWEGQEVECVCTGWNAPPDGKIYVKTDQIFGDWSNKVESSLVRIVLTPREVRLRQQAAAGEALHDQVEEIAVRATMPTLMQHMLNKVLTAYRIDRDKADVQGDGAGG